MEMGLLKSNSESSTSVDIVCDFDPNVHDEYILSLDCPIWTPCGLCDYFNIWDRKLPQNNIELIC